MATAEAVRDAATSVNESERAAASEPLRARVAFYSGYRQAGVAPAVHRGLPSPYMTLIFTLDDQINLAQHADLSQAAQSYDALLGGLHASPALITHDGRQSGIQVAVSPLASRALFGVPAGELAFIDVHAADVFGREAERVRERMQEAADWRERFAAVDAALRRRLSAPDLPAGAASAAPDEVARAWRLLLESRGTVPVSTLADEVGWSSRHLASRFRAEIGLTPKAAARVIRFDRVRRLMVAGPGEVTLAELAVRCGYFDQSHLDREFRLLAGCSPTRWLADEGYVFRNLQAERVRDE